jgi:pyruvate kinase
MKTKETLLFELKQIHESMLLAEHRFSAEIEGVNPANSDSAINLIDYLALRAQDIEPLQVLLHARGLSSLANSESHIKCQVLNILRLLGGEPENAEGISAAQGMKQLHHNVTQLLGEPGAGTAVPVMVTFAADFSGDTSLMVKLLENGMSIARINCAHDDRDCWAKMIGSLEKAKTLTGLPCKLYMDLAGPKIRTQVFTHGHPHGKLKVEKDRRYVLTDFDNDKIKDNKFISCTQPGIIKQLKPGDRVFFDDGLFEARIETVQEHSAIICITHIAAKKPVIKSEKGINFPDASLTINALSEYDRECLPFIVSHADMVGFSFVNTAADMRQLQEELKRLNKPSLPVIAKIETAKAVSHLAEIILQGMQQPMTGIMVARGDLAIEIGFERMSEIQDELLWICEAAHVPVIWATQVLENLHKRGIATRGEITDAAHAARADGVMINKGEHTLEVLHTLSDILNRSRKNNYKNRRLFRCLSIAELFINQH